MNAQAQLAVVRYRTALARTDVLLDSLPPLGGEDEDDSLDDTLPGDEPEPAPVSPPPDRERI